MRKNLTQKTILIVAVLIVFVFGIFGLPKGVSGTALKQAILDRIHLGLDLKGVTDRLVVEGVRSFADAADKLYGAVAKKRIAALGDKLNAQHLAIPEALAEPVKTLTETARADGWARRLWAGDAALWTGADEAKWIGWLPAARGERIDIPALEAFAGEVAGAEQQKSYNKIDQCPDDVRGGAGQADPWRFAEGGREFVA